MTCSVRALDLAEQGRDLARETDSAQGDVTAARVIHATASYALALRASVDAFRRYSAACAEELKIG